MDLYGECLKPRIFRPRVDVHTSVHIDCYDHDITDDWNLSAQWEETAYGHPFSKRIIGNALIAYLLCQGWGNNPDVFAKPLQMIRAMTEGRDAANLMNSQPQDALIDELLSFHQWQFVLPSSPALVVLNIFRHSRTPGNYVILSGDVHYSFVYEVLIRQRKRGPKLWQITSSGLKNEFPPRLLDWFDRLNRWLYAPWSPLNWLTTRRRMQVTPRNPSRSKAGERLWNGAGLGQVFFNEQGQPSAIYQLNADGSPAVAFVDDRDEVPASPATLSTAGKS